MEKDYFKLMNNIAYGKTIKKKTNAKKFGIYINEFLD